MRKGICLRKEKNMKKSTYKKILFVIILIVLMFMISTQTFASIVNMDPNTSFSGANQIKNVSEIFLGIIQVVAVAVAVIMLVVLAIKYMTAAPGEKADVKKSLVVYVIGALVLFAGAGILNLIQTIADDVNDELGAPTSSSSSSKKPSSSSSNKQPVTWEV